MVLNRPALLQHLLSFLFLLLELLKISGLVLLYLTAVQFASLPLLLPYLFLLLLSGLLVLLPRLG